METPLNIRVKIADFASGALFECRDGRASCGNDFIPLPDKFTAFAPLENIKYACKLFHLHSQAEAETLLNVVPSELAKEVDIIRAGEDWEGRGVTRYWLVKEGFAGRFEAEEWCKQALSILSGKLARKAKIEGGFYVQYPSFSVNQVTIKNSAQREVFKNNIIRIEAPNGINLIEAPVGESFHWEHTENLRFEGIIELRAGENGLLVINELPLERYLASVNSSEMSAESSIEFLKAQTIAARGTVLATKGCHHFGEPYDLCNGDHCQCFYGITRIEANSEEAADLTAGMALMHNGIIADTRYAKICGGMRESFGNVWEDFNPPYLPAAFDYQDLHHSVQNWDSYIQNSPQCWCNPRFHPYPDYYDYARSLFRWEVNYAKPELIEILKQKLGFDIENAGEILPSARGDSGRITGLLVQYDDSEIEISGELNIRSLLSPSHLPSSSFIIQADEERVNIKGAGWGHGVGMCQMGGLNMALNGANCKTILSHYYPHTELVKF